MNDLYEHDIKDKNLILVPNNTTKYLDTDIILYNNNKNVKLIYHNKNSNIIKDDYQQVGRFVNALDFMHIKMKINTLANILVRI